MIDFGHRLFLALDGGSVGCLVERDWMMLLVPEVLAFNVRAQSVIGI